MCSFHQVGGEKRPDTLADYYQGICLNETCTMNTFIQPMLIFHVVTACVKLYFRPNSDDKKVDE